jgi:tetratricopeptide (TPR) repeat protein
MNDKDTTEKLNALREQVAAEPDNIERRIDLARFYTDLGWFNDATEHYEQLLQMCPNDYALTLELANVAFTRRDYPTAQKYFSQLTTMRPDRIEGWNNLGIVLLTKGRFSEARHAFARVLEIEPDNAGALLNMGNCYFEQKNLDDARSCFEKAVAAAPDFADGWYNLGNVQREQNDLHKALESYKRSMRYRTDFPSALKNIGFVYEQLKEFDRALEYYHKALAQNKSDAGIWRNVAMVELRMDQIDSARENFLKAVRLQPRDIDGWMGLRHIALLKGDIESYVQATQAVLPRLDAGVLAQTCVTLRELQKYSQLDTIIDGADKAEKEGVELDCERLLSYQRRGSEPGRRAALEKKLRAASSESEACAATLARFYAHKEEYQKAQSMIEKVSRIDGDLRLLSLQILTQLREPAEVAEILDGHLQQYPDDCEGWFMRARLAAKMNNAEESQRFLTQALANGFSDGNRLQNDELLGDMWRRLSRQDFSV